MKIRYVVIGLFLVITAGMAWYILFEGMGIIDAFYMAVITITTVGFKEVKPLSNPGKVFTAIYIFVSLGFISYSLLSIGERFFENTVINIFLRRKMREIEKLKDHYIVCGYGRLGRFVVRELQKRGKALVVIDRDPEAISELEDKGIPYIEGDAREEEVLIKAGVKRARGIACLLESDADNLYVIFTARELNSDIFIVSRAESELGVGKMRKVGADKVILPYEEGGIKIAQTLLRPSLLEFFDLIIQRDHVSLEVDELIVKEGSRFIGKSLKDSGIRKDYGMIAIAIRKGERIIFNPDPDLVIEKGDILILMGEREMFEKLIGDEMA